MHRLYKVALALLIALLLTTAGYSQTIYATISGTATDQSGAVVPNAKVTVTRLETNTTASTISNDAGHYILPPLQEGTYNLKAEAAGFKDFLVEKIVLVNRDSRRIDIAFQLGTAATTIEVSAGGATLIDVESAKVSETLNQTDLGKLPLNARWMWAYFQMVPQMARDADGYRIGGGTGNDNAWTIDGTTMNDGQGWQIGPQLNYMGSISEVKVDLQNNAAEFGAIGQVSIVTSSGTNGFHGNIFDTYITSELSARNSFAGAVDNSQYHIWGFGVGGPVYLPKIYNGKDKTFFYTAFERSAGADWQNTLSAQVPLPSWRTGDFSNLPAGQLIYDPTTNQPFPGNKIPADRINQVSQLIQDKYYPQPNMGDNNVLSGINYQEQKTMPWYSPWWYSIKVDHHFSEKDYVFARYAPTGVSYKNWVSNLPTFGNSRNSRRSATATASYTHVFSSSVFNEFRWGLSFNTSTNQGPIRGQEEMQRLGLVGLAPDLPDVPGMLQISWSGIGLQSLQQTNGSNPGFRNHNEDFQDHLSWYRGKHNLKMGVQLMRTAADDFQIAQNLFGAANFSSRFTSGGIDGQGNPYADFLLGIPTSSARAWPNLPVNAYRWQYAGYFQDAWRMTKNFTLNFGLRYELHAPWAETHGQWAAFDINKGAIVVADSGMSRVSPLFPKDYVNVISATQAGLPSKTLVKNDWTNFGPRVGFAWNFAKDTVLRGGYGWMYEIVPPANSDYVAGIGSPFILSEPWETNPVSDPWMFPRVFPERPSYTITEANIPSAINPDIRIPRSQQYNVTFERQQWDTGFRVTYTGVGQRYGTYAYNYNSPVPDATPFIYKSRPFMKYGTINYRTDGAGHQYNALTAEVTRAMAKGLQGKFNWTWASDTGDVNRWGYIENPFDRQRDVGPIYSIPTHRITSNFVYEIPFGRGRKFGGTMPRVANLVAGGWTLSGVFVFDGGRHLTPMWSGPDPTGTAWTDSETAPWVTIRPDQVGDPNLPAGQRSTSNWFNAGAFTAPATGRFGNAKVGSIIGPNETFWNAGMQKAFVLAENWPRFVFEATARNVFNHPNYSDPDTNISNAGSTGHIWWAGGHGDESSNPREIRFMFRVEW
ncbi:MAG: carboxypeptidase regulatory-like domain-containing protein [Acidobacteriota bacterium]